MWSNQQSSNLLCPFLGMFGVFFGIAGLTSCAQVLNGMRTSSRKRNDVIKSWSNRFGKNNVTITALFSGFHQFCNLRSRHSADTTSFSSFANCQRMLITSPSLFSFGPSLHLSPNLFFIFSSPSSIRLSLPLLVLRSQCTAILKMFFFVLIISPLHFLKNFFPVKAVVKFGPFAIFSLSFLLSHLDALRLFGNCNYRHRSSSVRSLFRNGRSL